MILLLTPLAGHPWKISISWTVFVSSLESIQVTVYNKELEEILISHKPVSINYPTCREIVVIEKTKNEAKARHTYREWISIFKHLTRARSSYRTSWTSKTTTSWTNSSSSSSSWLPDSSVWMRTSSFQTRATTWLRVHPLAVSLAMLAFPWA